jgi:translation initiation factor 3 subunit B
LGKTAADQELVAQRKRLIDEWNAWRLKIRKQREEAGYSTAEEKVEEKEEVKEWVEELIDTIEEVVE